MLENVIPASLAIPRFSPFSQLVPSDNKDTIDVLAIVIKKFEKRRVESPSKSYVIHEFVLINDEKKPLILSLWNNIASSEGQLIMNAYDSMPVILARKLTVTYHYGMSLGLTLFTTVVIDPPISDVQRLKTWRANNQQAIADALVEVEEIMKAPHSAVQPTRKFYSILDVARIDDMDKFMLKVKVQVTDLDQKFFYIGCEYCHASYAADYNWEIDCYKCNKRGFTKPREMVIANIIDETGSLKVTAFGEDAVKIMNMNAVMAMEMYNAGNSPCIEKMTASIESKIFIVKLKKTRRQKQKHDDVHVQYTVLSLIEDKQQMSESSIDSTVNLGENSQVMPSLDKPLVAKRLSFGGENYDAAASTSRKKMKGILTEAPTEKGGGSGDVEQLDL